MKISRLILPKDSFMLTTALLANEVKRRITENTHHKKHEYSSNSKNLFKYRYTALIKDNNFIIIQYLEGNGKKFEIHADGKLISDTNGTKIEIKTGLEAVTKTIGILFLIFTIFFLALGIAVNLKENPDNSVVFFLIIPTVLLVFYIVLVSAMFKNGNKKLKEFLIRILNANKSSPVKNGS